MLLVPALNHAKLNFEQGQRLQRAVRRAFWATTDAMAAEEGISRSDVARRALKRELRRNPREALA